MLFVSMMYLAASVIFPLQLISAMFQIIWCPRRTSAGIQVKVGADKVFFIALTVKKLAVEIRAMINATITLLFVYVFMTPPTVSYCAYTECIYD